MRPSLPALLGILLALVFPAAALAAAPASSSNKYFLVTIDQVTLEQLAAADAPTIHHILNHGALALMVARSASSYHRGGYLTIGAGTRLAAEHAAGDIIAPEGFAFAPDEVTPLGPAASAYVRLTGRSPGRAEALHLAIGAISRLNADLDYPALPGLLAQTLAENGLRVACLGQADLSDLPYRPIAALAMDTDGKIPLASLGPRLTTTGAYGRPQVSVKAMLAELDRLLPQADFIAIDFADTVRLFENEELLTPEALATRRQAALARADALLSGILQRMRPADRLMLVTPHLTRGADRQQNGLSHVVTYGGTQAPGLLYSPSTRADGLVVNTDLAPAILKFFGLQAPPQMVGRPLAIVVSEERENLFQLLQESTRFARIESQRYLLTRPAMVAIILVFVLCALALLLDLRLPSRLLAALRFALLLLLSWPIAMLFLGSFLPAGISTSGLVVCACVLFLALAAILLASRDRPAFILLSTLLAALVVLALLEPSQSLLRLSPLSYSPGAGARYYGLGNEFGGLFIGALLFACVGLWNHKSALRRFLRWPVMAAALLLLGAGFWGANFGIALSALVAFWVVGLLVLRPGSLWRRLWVIALIAAIIAMIALEFMRGPGVSHIGLAAQHLHQDKSGFFSDLLLRKIGMNIRLLRHSMWADVLAATLGFILLAAVKLGPRFSAALALNPGLRTAFWASLAGAGAAFLFNDSGTISAALCLLYPASALAFLILDANHDKTPSN